MNTIFHYDNRQVGFGSAITVAFSTINYCINNNLECHIKINNVMYGDQDQNLWDLFLQQPFNVEEMNPYIYAKTTNPFKSGYWDFGGHAHNMDIALQNIRNNNFIVKQKELYKKYFIINDSLEKEINDFFQDFKNKKILGIHRRGRDQLFNGHGANQRYKLELPYLYSVVDTEIDQYDYLYLTSDENYIYEAFKDRYGKKIIYIDNKDDILEYNKGLHEIFINSDKVIKNSLLKTMLKETICLSRCDKLLLVNSNLSQIALYLCKHFNYKFYDEHVNYQ